MALTLSLFLRQQLTTQQLTEREFSDRSGLGLSHVYQILRGDRKHTRGDTLDKIASALNMTPAEMAVAMGRAGGIDPDETELLTIYRQVSDEDRPTVKSMLRGLVGHRVTKSDREFGSSKKEVIDHVAPTKRKWPKREPRNNAYLEALGGYQPAYS